MTQAQLAFPSRWKREKLKKDHRDAKTTLVNLFTGLCAEVVIAHYVGMLNVWLAGRPAINARGYDLGTDIGVFNIKTRPSYGCRLIIEKNGASHYLLCHVDEQLKVVNIDGWSLRANVTKPYNDGFFSFNSELNEINSIDELTNLLLLTK